jgi:hypothetical protein
VAFAAMVGASTLIYFVLSARMMMSNAGSGEARGRGAFIARLATEVGAGAAAVLGGGHAGADRAGGNARVHATAGGAAGNAAPGFGLGGFGLGTLGLGGGGGDSDPRSGFAPLRHECLHVVTPTMPRKGDPRYLIQTLKSVVGRTEHHPGMCTEATVVNTRPGQHPVFEEARLRFAGAPVRFFERETRRPTLTTPVPGIWRPTNARDVRQSNDALEMFDVIRTSVCVNGRRYFMLLEDDVELCENAEAHIPYVMRKASQRFGGDDGWSVIRVSQGLIGIIMQCRDVDAYMDYLDTHILDGPIDYVLADMWTKASKAGAEYFGSRKFVIYRYNLFKHLGRVSSFHDHVEDHSGRVYHRCFDVLSSLLHANEMFHSWCLHDDLAPCNAQPLEGGTADFFEEGVSRSVANTKSGNIHPFLVSPYVPLTNSPLFVQDFQGVHYIVGSDMTCESTCNEFGLACDDYVLLHLNQCSVLQKYLTCPRCAISTWQDGWFPGMLVPRPDAEPNPLDGACLVAPVLALLRCNGRSYFRGDGFRRLCPCRPRADVTSSTSTGAT